MRERLQEILQIAVNYDVTDIHFDVRREKECEKTIVEMRVKGKIRRLKEKKDDMKLFRYLMYRANLDVSDALRPQTGSFHEEVNGKMLSLRFATVSSYHIMSGVLRILNCHGNLKISDLTFDEDVISWMEKITDHRNGLFIFTGPTGSGKTTSLYTILNACTGKKIFTLEDPVEVVNEKYIQIQINEKQHMSYADGIRQLMRHDPDIVMIGEIRDEEAARMAVRCALTGHLVLTSLHASSCISAIYRMEDLGVDMMQMEDVLAGICSQRLYETEEGKKVSVYEYMDRRQLQTWFTTKKVPEDFHSLSEKTIKAIENGWITKESAEADTLA